MGGGVRWNLIGTIACVMIGSLFAATTSAAAFSSANNVGHKHSPVMLGRSSSTAPLQQPPVVVQWLRQSAMADKPHAAKSKRWLDLFGGSSVETRFPLPSRRQFPEVDWRGFNEDIFHESFGDFNPVKRWGKRNVHRH